MNIREQRVLVKEVVYSCKRLGVSLQEVKTDARGNKEGRGIIKHQSQHKSMNETK